MGEINGCRFEAEYIDKSGQHPTVKPCDMDTHPLGHYIEIFREFLGSPPSVSEASSDSRKDFREELDCSPHMKKRLVTKINSNPAKHIPRFTPLSEVVQKKLFVAYIKWFHPQLPILDLAKFLEEMLNNETLVKESLFYQALFFAGTIFVEQNTVTEAGYESKDLMAAALAAEVKYLYYMDSESNDILKLQTFLLMTYWHEIYDENGADQGIWLSLAHKTAKEAGIFPPFDKSSQGSINRRLWACLYLRDSLISLAIRQPSCLKAPELSPVILQSDLDCSKISLEAKKQLPPRSMEFLDVKFQFQTQILFLQKIDLCVCINSILSRMFGSSSPECNESIPVALNLYPLKNSPVHVVQECYSLLHDWITSPRGGTYFDLPFPFFTRDSGSTETVIRVYQADVNLLYLAASATFYSCLSTSSSQAQKTCEYISMDIVQTISDLRDAKLDCYLQPTSITALICAASSQFPGPSFKEDENASSLILRKCADMAQGLIKLYPRAGLVLKICSFGPDIPDTLE